MSRKPALKPKEGNRFEDLERRLAQLEMRTRGASARDVRSGTSSNSTLVYQTAHGLSVGEVVREDGSGWTTSDGRHPDGIVQTVLSPDAFVVVSGGLITGLSGLSAGTAYYDSFGSLLPFDPLTGPTQVTVVLHAISATEGFVVCNQRIGADGLPGVVGVFLLPSSWGLGTPLTHTGGSGSIGRAVATAYTTSQVIGCISGGLKIDGSNTYYVVRRSGRLGTEDLLSTPWINAFSSNTRYYLDTTAGSVTTTAPSSPNIANVVIEVVDGIPYAVPQAVSPATWDAINDKPAAFPPSGSVSLTVNTTDVTDSAALTFSGTFAAQTWTFYEKRPRFNAKWLQDYEIDTTNPVGTAPQLLLFDTATTKWTPYRMWNVSAVTGWINCYDSTVSDSNGKSTGVMAGTARSVFGRSAATDGLPAAITATADNQILARTSGTLSWLTAPTTATQVLSYDGSGLAWRSIRSITGTAATGSPWTSGTPTWTVPSGVYRIMVAVVGGGGGAGYGPSNTLATVAWVAASSGGATTTSWQVAGGAAGGGNGGMALAWVDVTPGEIISMSIGTGGAGSASALSGGTGGNSTTVTFPSSGGTITCTGGGGAQALPNVAGTPGSTSHTVASSRNPIVVNIPAHTGNTSAFYIGTGGSVNAYVPGTSRPSVSVVTGGSYGIGGAAAAGTGASGTDGAVAIWY